MDEKMNISISLNLLCFIPFFFFLLSLSFLASTYEEDSKDHQRVSKSAQHLYTADKRGRRHGQIGSTLYVSFDTISI